MKVFWKKLSKNLIFTLYLLVYSPNNNSSQKILAFIYEQYYKKTRKKNAKRAEFSMLPESRLGFSLVAMKGSIVCWAPHDWHNIISDFYRLDVSFLSCFFLFKIGLAKAEEMCILSYSPYFHVFWRMYLRIMERS